MFICPLRIKTALWKLFYFLLFLPLTFHAIIPKTTDITPVTGKDKALAGQAIKAPKKQPPAKPENHHKIVFNILLPPSFTSEVV